MRATSGIKQPNRGAARGKTSPATFPCARHQQSAFLPRPPRLSRQHALPFQSTPPLHTSLTQNQPTPHGVRDIFHICLENRNKRQWLDPAWPAPGTQAASLLYASRCVSAAADVAAAGACSGCFAATHAAVDAAIDAAVEVPSGDAISAGRRRGMGGSAAVCASPSASMKKRAASRTVACSRPLP